MYHFILFFFLSLSSSFIVNAQPNDSTVLWAFPITEYVMPLNDSAATVQIILPGTVHFIKGKQLGVLRGIYRNGTADTAARGWGKCHLIKQEYNYFAIHLNKGQKPVTGDLIYTFIPKIKGSYESPVFYCAAHCITLLSVTDSAFYTPQEYLLKRTKVQDEKLVDNMVKDIRYTGSYFLKEDSTQNVLITSGPFKGNRVLDKMAKTDKAELTNFLRYVAARPRLYAGNQWKISETYATWLMSGASTPN